ncbi:hypothetical protein PYCC9005_003159 [Savitreella phatthalungensis]
MDHKPRANAPLSPQTHHVSVLAEHRPNHDNDSRARPQQHSHSPRDLGIKIPLTSSKRSGVISPPTPYTGSSNYTDTEWREVQGWGSVKETTEIHKMTDERGRKCINRYEIIREIGRGVHGKVKLARTMDNNELVALKVLPKTTKQRLGRPQNSAAHEATIRREIAILKKCVHPHVVRLREVIDDPTSDKIYLVLEYMWGGEVVWRTESHKPALKLHQARSTFRDTVLGLEFLHYQGIIHRDIKPANLLWTKNHSVKISDFGVSHVSDVLQDDGRNAFDLAKTAGTPAFFAPELCWTGEGERPPITKAIDIWALGVTLFCLLTGRVPFEAANEFELFERIAHEQVAIPLDDLIDAEAADLLRKMLVKDPLKRLTIAQVKKHAFVLKGVKDPQGWLCDTDPSLFGVLEVTEHEVSQAVSTFDAVKRRLGKLGSRIASGLKRRTGLDGSKTPSTKAPSQIPSATDVKSIGSMSSSWMTGFMKTQDSGRSSRSAEDSPASSFSAMPMSMNRHSSLHRACRQAESGADERLVESLTAAINSLSGASPTGSPNDSLNKPLPSAPFSPISTRTASTGDKSAGNTTTAPSPTTDRHTLWQYHEARRSGDALNARYRSQLNSSAAMTPILTIAGNQTMPSKSLTRSRGFDSGLTPEAMQPQVRSSAAGEPHLADSGHNTDNEDVAIGSIDGVLSGEAHRRRSTDSLDSSDSDLQLEKTQTTGQRVIGIATRSPIPHPFSSIKKGFVRRIDDDHFTQKPEPYRFGQGHDRMDNIQRDSDSSDEGLTVSIGSGRRRCSLATVASGRDRANSAATTAGGGGVAGSSIMSTGTQASNTPATPLSRNPSKPSSLLEGGIAGNGGTSSSFANTSTASSPPLVCSASQGSSYGDFAPTHSALISGALQTLQEGKVADHLIQSEGAEEDQDDDDEPLCIDLGRRRSLASTGRT